MFLVAVLQLGNAVAGQLVPRVAVGNSVLATLTLFDSVTQTETAADPSSVVATVVRPDGVSVPLVVASPSAGVYQASVPLAQAGTYALTLNATSGAGTQLIVAQGQINAVAPAAIAGVSAMNTWLFVNAPKSPYAATPAIPFIAVDLRQGAVSVVFWPTPSDGDEITIRDWFNLSSVSAGPGLPGGPIGYSAAGPVVVENVASPGTYGASGSISVSAGFSKTWKYSLQQNAWGLKD